MELFTFWRQRILEKNDMRYEDSLEVQTMNFVFPRSDNTSAVSQSGGNFSFNFKPRKVVV